MEYFSWYPLPVFTPTAENRRAVRKARELEANTSAQSCPKCKTCDREFCAQIGLIIHLRSHLCNNWSCDLHQHRCKNIITPSQFSRHYFSVPPSNVPNFCLLKTTPFSNSLPFLQGFLICIFFFFVHETLHCTSAYFKMLHAQVCSKSYSVTLYVLEKKIVSSNCD